VNIAKKMFLLLHQHFSIDSEEDQQMAAEEEEKRKRTKKKKMLEQTSRIRRETTSYELRKNDKQTEKEKAK
jgi:hypothetical protein